MSLLITRNSRKNANQRFARKHSVCDTPAMCYAVLIFVRHEKHEKLRVKKAGLAVLMGDEKRQ